ncbi:MAG TPA: hypothetical protein ACFYEK_08355 [Candidatus Wunengus sp. YC60]|uniref:hypothetical protein n=1 Tax=Candidatus Wunengus sp. YC60 TaxID=3367697 RepID=UPI004028AF72
MQIVTAVAKTTPQKAIKLECKCCMGMAKSFSCDSKLCKLNGKSFSPLRRIKAHCLDCVETRQEVKDYTGKLFSEDRLCNLHPYRFGHNPKRKGMGSAENFRKTSTHDMVLALKS